MPPTYSWKEKIDRRSAKVEQSKIAYQRVYQLIVSERVDEATARTYVQSAGPAPNLQIGQAHPVDTNAKLLTIDMEDEAEDGRQWLVTVAWETLTGAGTLNPDPFSRPAEIEWDQASQTVPIEKDFSTTPKLIRNSVGMKFDELPTRERALPTLTYTRNETVSHFRTVILPLLVYDYVINSASFTVDGVSIPALYCRLKIRGSKQTEAGTDFYRVTYTLEFRPGPPGHESDGWREYILDVGYYEFAPGSTEFITPIRDNDGKDVSQPWPLDGSGAKKLHPDDPPAELGPFKFNREVSFSSLGLT